MSNIIDMTAALLARREEELRRRFGVEPGQTALPVGFLVQAVIGECRLKMAERRNQGERR